MLHRSLQLDDYWLNLRLKEAQIPAAHLRSVPNQNIDSTLPTIKDALELYHRVKGEGQKNHLHSQLLNNVWVVSWISTPVQMHDIQRFS